MNRAEKKEELLKNREIIDAKIASLTEALLEAEEGTTECDKVRSELNNYRGMSRDNEFDLRFV